MLIIEVLMCRCADVDVGRPAESANQMARASTPDEQQTETG